MLLSQVCQSADFLSCVGTCWSESTVCEMVRKKKINEYKLTLGCLPPYPLSNQCLVPARIRRDC